MKGLTRNDFRILDEEERQPITSFQPTGAALELVVAVDVSGSMADAMSDVKLAVKKFLGALGQKDEVTLVAFNDALFTLARRESNAAARARAVERLSAWGGTALYDVIVRSLDICRGNRDAAPWSYSATATISRASPRSTTSSASCAWATPRCSWSALGAARGSKN